ncbi:hypothetical protein GpartN1_g7627.t1 [Galdieria partita]|uniref:Uncharacterized protein n=1 Tax=Galdieria partita TaxID=83374 RepID=A0A9C7UUD5_9RHOD|nr:hypothetical protein GpartN1_g7627.t1 [Galdieria partita]
MKLLELATVFCFVVLITGPSHSIPIYEDAFSYSQTYGDAEASGYAEVIPTSTKVPELQAASFAESTNGGRAHQVDFAEYSQGYPFPISQPQNFYLPYQPFPFQPQFNQYPVYQPGYQPNYEFEALDL